jgi:SNF family Na+-dependent transporter
VPRPQPQRWKTRIGVIMAVAGSAVGLGNFLRFPGQAAQHGGGAFMIPYFTALLLLGIPLCWAEWTMGRYGGSQGFNSAPGIFGAIAAARSGKSRPWARYLGVLALVVPLVVYMYYVVIEAWCLAYAWNYASGSLMLGSDPAAYKGFFTRFTGSTADGSLISGDGLDLVYLVVAVSGLNLWLILRGIGRGIETFCNIALPTMAVLAVFVLVRVLTLGAPDPAHPERNVAAGLGFMWNPDLSALSDPRTWLAAAGQVFFTLGVGFGIIINYSSYVRRNDDIVLSGATAAVTNEFFEVCLGGLITLPAAFLFVDLAAGSFSTFGLGFETLPNVFAAMPGGRACGAAWFFMLFLAAVTSSVAMLQPVLAFFEEGLGLHRGPAVASLGALTLAGSGLVIYYSGDMAALGAMDFWGGTFLMVLLAFVQSILYGWLFGIEKGEEEAHRGANMRIPRVVQYVLKYVSPLYLAIVIGMFFWEGIPEQIASLGKSRPALIALIFIVGMLVLFLTLTAIASRRWAKAAKFKS